MIPSKRQQTNSFRIAVLSLSFVLLQAFPVWAMVSEHQSGGGSSTPPPAASVPEIDPKVALGGLTLALGGLLVLTDRRR